MSSESYKCWLCNSTETFIWRAGTLKGPLVSSDLQITDKRYGTTLTLLKCRSCQFIFSDRSELSELETLYRNLDDPGYEETQEPRSIQMQWLLKKIIKASPAAKTFLDIGAGTGLLVNEARKQNLDAVGIEPSCSLVAFGKQRHGIRLLRGLFPHPELKETQFDVITLIDVIEHVQDPVQVLKDCGDALNQEGILLLVTPDVHSFMAKAFGRKWWHFRLAHVCYFDWQTIKKALDVAGLEVCSRFRPLWFFELSYIAIRLEQYFPFLHRVNFVLRKNELCRRIGHIQIPLNLFDSWGIIVRKKRANRHG